MLRETPAIFLLAGVFLARLLECGGTDTLAFGPRLCWEMLLALSGRHTGFLQSAEQGSPSYVARLIARIFRLMSPLLHLLCELSIFFPGGMCVRHRYNNQRHHFQFLTAAGEMV